MIDSPHTDTQLIVLDPSEVSAICTVAAAHGVEVEQVPSRGVEPVAIVTVVLMGSVAAVATVQHILDQRRGGQVVDLRPGAPKPFYRTPDVVYGTAVIVTRDGTVTVEVKEPDGMFGKVVSALPALVSGGDSDAEQVARAVTETFGTAVEIEAAKRPQMGSGE